MGRTFPYMKWKMKNVPNHQPVIICFGFNFHMDGSLMMFHHFDNRASMQQLRRKPKKHLQIRNKLIPWNNLEQGSVATKFSAKFNKNSTNSTLPGPPLSALSAPQQAPSLPRLKGVELLLWFGPVLWGVAHVAIGKTSSALDAQESCERHRSPFNP